MLGGLCELQHTRSDTGRRIDDQRIELLADAAERLYQAQRFRIGQICQPCHARGTRHDRESGRRLEYDLVEGSFAGDNVGEVVSRRQTKQNIYIRKSQVTIEQQGAPSSGRQCRSEIDGNGRFANATFTAADGDDLNRSAARNAHRSV